MVRLLSSRLADFLIENKIVEAEDKEIYIYGYEILISSAIGVALVLILGFLFNLVIETVIFLAEFILIRQSCGGYHANSYLKCILSFLSVFVLVILALNIFLVHYSYLIWIVLSAMCMSVMMELSPIENINKPLTQKTKSRNRKISIVLSAVVIIAAAILLGLDARKSLLIMLTLTAICLLMMYERLKGGANDEEH